MLTNNLFFQIGTDARHGDWLTHQPVVFWAEYPPLSHYPISQYYTEVDKIYQYGGDRKETSIRNCFYNLLNNSYAQSQHLILIPELDYRLPTGKIVFSDGTLKDALRLDWGYWESKDTSDDLSREIDKKFAAGYPNSNILFEGSQTAALFQDGEVNILHR